MIPRGKTPLVLVAGFGAVIALMLALLYMVLSHAEAMRKTGQALLHIEEKTELAFTMREAMRKRSFSLALTQAMDDFFDRDAERQRFNFYARDFVVAREKLISLGIDSEEQAILDRFEGKIRTARPLVEDAMAAAVEGLRGPMVKALIDRAVNAQNHLFEYLDRFVAVQKRLEGERLAQAERDGERALRFLVLFGGLTPLIGLAIAVIVIRRERWHLNSLVNEIAQRKKAEYSVRELNASLEERVGRRTRELREEVAVRKKTEIDLRQAKDEAEFANEAKSNFLASMSHELRTPMNAILGFSQVLLFDRNEKLLPKQREYLDYIFKSGRHLLELINQVLELSKINSGKIDLSFGEVDPVALIEDSLAMVESMAEKRFIEIVRTYDGKTPYRLVTDGLRYKQVLLNLLSNAVKYNRTGGTITVGFDETPRNMARVTITDTGEGFSPDRLGELFQPFNRLGKEAGRVEGAGIGLAITKELVEMMGGNMGCDSEVGRGSTFWFELPFEKSVEAFKP